MDVSFLQPVSPGAGAAEVVVVPRAARPDDVPVAAILRYPDDPTPSAQ